MPKSQNSQIMSLMFETKRRLASKFRHKKNFLPEDLIKTEILTYLRKNKNSNMKKVARFLGITPPSATALVDKLVINKYLDRRQDPNDRRKIILIVTKKGEKFIKTFHNNFQEIIKNCLSPLNKKDKKDLIRIYNKLLDKK